MTKQTQTQTNSGIFFIIAAAILWGTTGTSQALAPENANPLSIGAARLAVGGVCLTIVTFLQGGLRKWTAPFLPVLLGGAFLALYQVSFFSAVKLTGVAAGTIVAIGSSPIFAGILDVIFQKKLPGKRWILSTILAVSGCTLLALSSGEVHINRLGIILALVAGLSYASVALCLKVILKKTSAEECTSIVFITGAIILLPILFIYDSGWMIQPRGVMVTIHLGIFATALAYYLFSRGMETTPLSSAVTLTLAEPFTAALLGVIVLGEKLSFSSGVGIILILAGISILVLPGRKRKQQTANTAC